MTCGIASSVTVPYFGAVAVSIAGAAGIHVHQKPSPRFGSSGVAAVVTVELPTVTVAPLTAAPVLASVTLPNTRPPIMYWHDDTFDSCRSSICHQYSQSSDT